MTSLSISSALLVTAVSAALCACASQPPTAQPAANFQTPPAWMDRVSVVPYMAKVDYDAPLPTGDHTNEAARFTFRGHPLHPELQDQGQGQDNADEGAAADAGGADMDLETGGEEAGGGAAQ